MQPDVEKRLLGGSLTSDFLGGVSSRLAGGLNLLPAGGSIQVRGCIAAQNWRTAQAGMLRSRKGMTLVQALAGHIHTIQTVQRAAGNTRHYGADHTLYREGASIDTGYDSNPIGTVSFQGRLWAMTRSRQKKDDGVNYWDWTPAGARG